ncbi:MAG: esterase family protein [Lachnospiraceae bacterium]|nr:esterase family protein [Lachnospiraceae bacterium]
MAFINMNFYSYYLGMETPLTVLLPEHRGKAPELINQNYPVLYLLHGHSNDNTTWIRSSNIEILIRDCDCIVVMPTAHRSFYANSLNGLPYEDYLVKELPIVISNFFHASLKREDTYIAGISMGGYGALKYAMKYPEKYGHVACLSGAGDVYDSSERARRMSKVSDQKTNMDFLDHIFGSRENFLGSDNDLKTLVKKLDARTDIEQPQMYICCGESDPLYRNHLELKSLILNETKLDVQFSELSGSHNWDYWNRELPRILQYFSLNSGEASNI